MALENKIQYKTDTIKYLLRLFSLIVSVFLIACAEESTPGDTTSPPTDILVSSSNGDMNKYMGTWISSCGNSLTNNSIGVKIVFEITSITGNSVYGMVEERVYNNIQCTGVPDLFLSQSYEVSLTYVDLSSVDNVSLNSRYVGNADELEVTYATQTPVTRYVGFMNTDSEFILRSTVNFSVFDLVYSKLN